MQNNDSPVTESAQLRPNTKRWHVLATLLERSMNRFEAERLCHDHCLHSTVADLQKLGLRIDRKDEVVPGFRGNPTHVARYWIEPDQHQTAQRLLGRD